MSFDAQSLERLRQLGRSLPKPLPVPEPPAARVPRADQPRHKLETETNPETLFAELMQASADGTVPPHLLDRLRTLEAARLKRQPAPATTPGSRAEAPSNRESSRPGKANASSNGKGLGRPDPRLIGEHQELYTAFQQLLLEDDEALP
jgi:hypothetical protein